MKREAGTGGGTRLRSEPAPGALRAPGTWVQALLPPLGIRDKLWVQGLQLVGTNPAEPAAGRGPAGPASVRWGRGRLPMGPSTAQSARGGKVEARTTGMKSEGQELGNHNL